jgi:CheY-like chemotaxis protein
VRTDRQLLRRILRNLIANALKYTKEGRVLVGARRKASTIALEVLDTGIGIPREKHGLIFQEFHRLDPRATAARGLGLGLSIVERISRMLNHPISVRSEVGRGSRFTLDLPRGSAMAEVVPIAEAVAGHRDVLEGALVICIDNEPDVLLGMRTLLAGWGCIVIAEATPKAAIAALDSYTGVSRIGAEKVAPAIVLADYHLDEGTGIDAVRDLRAHLSADVPGVIITADHSPEVRRRLRELELTLLPKPLKAGALRAVMMQSVRRMAAE